MARSRALVGGMVLALVLSSCVELKPETISVEETRPPESADMTPSSDAAPAPGELDITAESEVATWLPADEPPGPGARALVPLQMYYVERYLADVPDKTDVDLAIGAILDQSPDALDVFVRALETYRSMSLEAKDEFFDPGVVAMTASFTAALDMDGIRDHVASQLTLPDFTALEAPTPPSDLKAANMSRGASLEQDPTGARGPSEDTYRVALAWRDNSSTEEGFRVYRWPYLTLAGVAPKLIATLGPDMTSFEDQLLEPISYEEKVCYEVTAYDTAPTSVTGQEPSVMESAPTDSVCTEYHWVTVDSRIDTGDNDVDGLINEYDECPNTHDNGNKWTPGCPDQDRDGWWDNGTDQCVSAWGDPVVPGETSPYKSAPGCPQRYAVSWMGMDVINNSAAYIHHLTNISDPWGKYAGLQNNEVDDRPGEEPYLIFTWVNGLTTTGAEETGETQWCCGEEIDVAKGYVHEPDGTTPEGDPALDTAISDHGMAVFPVGEISDSPGLLITVMLMEKDWQALVRPEYVSATVGDMVEVAAEAALVIGGCISSAGIGCLIDIGEAIVEGLLSIFGMSSQLIEVDDPDDVMGDGVWVITRKDALFKTAENGAYGFSFEIPTPSASLCLPPATPCTPDIAIPSKMGATMLMCLHREGIPIDQLKSACQQYQPVLPWPMEPLTVP